MKFFREQIDLHRRYNSSEQALRTMYPFYFSEEQKKRILFIQPRIDRYELFTLICPAFYFNSMSKFLTTMVTGFEPDTREFEPNVSVDAFLMRSELYSTYIPKADLVVLPFTFKSLSTQPSVDKLSIYDQIRRANPNVRILYTVDFNYYAVPKTHFNYRLIKDNIKNIEGNIRNADGIICANDLLPELIISNAELKGIRAILIPALFDQVHFTDIDFTTPPENPKGEKVRLGIPSDLYRREDIDAWKDLYLWLHNNYKDQVELVFYGYHPDKEIDLRDPREGLINNEQKFPKPKGRAKYKNFVTYFRQRRNDYMYNFKNFYNLNCDAWLFLYDPKSDFWKYSAKDVDMLYAIYTETPVFTNIENVTNLPAYTDMASIKKALTEFIEYNIKHRRLSLTSYKQQAINFGHTVLNEIMWTEPNFIAIEDQFISMINNR